VPGEVHTTSLISMEGICSTKIERLCEAQQDGHMESEPTLLLGSTQNRWVMLLAVCLSCTQKGCMTHASGMHEAAPEWWLLRAHREAREAMLCGDSSARLHILGLHLLCPCSSAWPRREGGVLRRGEGDGLHMLRLQSARQTCSLP
jgi:hypothetical protein